MAGTAWALERRYPHRFGRPEFRPEITNQIAVVGQGRPQQIVIGGVAMQRLKEAPRQGATAAAREGWKS
jgi:hypothetical protein